MINPFFFAGHEITPLRRLLYLKGIAGENEVEYTVTGNPVTFSTTLAKPLTGLTIPFTPVQSGSGDPSPTNVREIVGWTGCSIYRTGINLFDQSFYSVSSNYKKTLGNYIYTDPIRLAPNTTYTFSPQSTDSIDSGIYFVLAINKTSDPDAFASSSDADFIYPVYNGKLSGAGVTNTFTTKSTGVIRLGVSTANIATHLPKIMSTNWQLEVGSSASVYSEYSGTTIPVTFPALGKNLFNKSATDTSNGYITSMFLNNSGGTGTSQNFNISEYIPVSASETYCLSSITGSNPSYCLYTADKVFISGNKYDGASSVVIQTPSNAAYLRISIPVANVDSVQLEQGSTASTYEPFNSTVYGGYIDAVAGQVVASGICHTFTGSDNYRMDSKSGGVRVISNSMSGLKSGTANAMCDKIKKLASTPSTITEFGFYVGFLSYQIEIYIPTGTIGQGDPTLDDFKAWANSNNFTIYSELATPIVVATIDPITLNTLANQVNTVWTDTNGTNEVKYLTKG